MLEDAREEIAELLGAAPAEVVFTSGGTEADNLGILGAARAALAGGADTRVLVSAAEHHSVLDAAEQAGREGARVALVPVSPEGAPTAAAMRAELAAMSAEGPGSARATEKPAYVFGAMHANNEIGTLTGTAELAGIAAAAYGVGGHFHVDAVQSAGHVHVDFAASGADSMSMSGHKFGAPIGIGALLARRTARIQQLGFGGGQERDLRSGSVNVPGAVAMAVALRESIAEMDAEARRLVALRDRLATEILSAVPGSRLVGPAEPGGFSRRLPGNVNIVFPGSEGESMIMLLDERGISCSTGSACTAGVAEPSHVALATGMGAADARSVLRFTLGHTSTDADVDAVLRAMPEVAAKARSSAVTGSRLRPGR